MANNELELMITERTAELRKANEQLRIELAERKHVEQELRESENQFRTLAETASDAIITIDEQGRIVFINRAAERVFGYSQEEMLNEELTMLMPECRRHLHRAGFTRYKEEGKRHISWEAIELRGMHMNGSEIPLEISFGEFKQDDKRFFTGIARDITERKLAEETLRRTEFEYRNLVESVQAIVWRGDARTFQFSFVSKEAESLLGYPAEHWVSDPTFWRDHIHPDDRDWAVSFCVRATEETRDHEFEYRMIAADGRVVWLRDIVRVVVENGDVSELVGVMVDVTERKLTEEALRQSEKKFSTIFQTIPDPVLIVRLSDVFVLDVNDAWTQQTGYLKSERVGKTGDELNIYVDQGLRKRHIEELLERSAFHNLEAKYRRKDGSLMYALTSARIIELDGEQCAVVIAKDITDLKLAEEAVRHSETKFRTLAETTPSAIFVHRFDEARILYVNPAMEEISGYSEAELLELTLWDLLHPDFVEIVDQRRLARVRDEPVSPRIELKLLTKSGEDRWVDQSVGRIEFEGEAAIIVTAFDITDRKRAEDALRRSEERYRLIVENQTEFIVKWLPDGTRTFVNESYCRYFGIGEEDCLGTSFFPLVAPEFREAIHRKTASLTPGAPEYTEEHLSMVPGGQRWQQWTNRGIFDTGGNLIELLSTGRDITERKTAEEALQDSEARGRRLNERFSLAVESAGIGVWDLDLVNNELAWDQQMYDLYQVDPGGFGGAYEEWARGVHPDDLPRVRAEVQQAIKGVKPFDTDFQVVWPDGEARHIKAFARVVRDERGAPVRMTGINYDITERRRAEEELRQSREQLRALSSHLQSVREEERTHIAREVHDELGQALTALKIDLYALQRDLTKEGGINRLTAKMKSMSSLIDETIQSVRRIATELRPGILDDLGLVAAVEWQANDFQNRTGISCGVASRVDYLDLDRDRSTATFRILQETLTNVARHAGASRVDIALKRDEHSLVLEVKDNGSGIAENDIAGSDSLGLLGMRERAHLLGGELEISGTAGKGTAVTVRIPLS